MKFYVESKLSENIAETREGYLVCQGVPIARTGEMVYAGGELGAVKPGPDGKIYVQRDAQEVFRPETIASFQGKPITIGHPGEFVKPHNWSQLAKGTIQNVRRGTGEHETDLIADLLITDSVAIELVKNGLREVSCGYDVVVYETGVGRAEHTEIIGNHLALVSAGRAGESYAINDHKGESRMSKLTDKIKALFTKAQDDALKLVDEESKGNPVQATDLAGSGENANGAPPSPSQPVSTLDEVSRMVKDLAGKIDGMMVKPTAGAVDASTQPTQSSAAEVKAGDSIEERLKKCEDALAGLTKAKDADEEETENVEDADGDDEVTDADSDEEGEEVEAGDEAAEVVALDEDTASRVEILAPGLKVQAKDAKSKAVEACYQTTDGKSIIEKLTGGKAPDLGNEGQIAMIFVGASEILKAARSGALAKTRVRTFDMQSSGLAPKGAMTPEEHNKKMEAHYSGKK